ncbi:MULTISPECIES: TRAP transporter small permease [Actinomycetes]|uniref:Tripartite ATP-independent periplasmic transporters DctQ component domain-containing protein n=2 Tax=Actinomycetes TaxID=1760 RepID=A0ABP6LVG0_9MICC
MSDVQTHEDLARDMSTTSEDHQADRELAQTVWTPARWLFHLAAGTVLLLTLFVSGTVILRAAGIGVPGSVELAAASMVLLTVLALPAVTALDRNFRMDLIDLIAPARALRILDRIALGVQAVVAVFLAGTAVLLAVKDLTTGITMLGELAWPRWILTAPVAMGLLTLAYVLAVRLSCRPRNSASCADETRDR